MKTEKKKPRQFQMDTHGVQVGKSSSIRFRLPVHNPT